MIFHPTQKTLPFIFLLNTFEGIAVLAIMILTPSDGKNSVLAGFSLQRLLLLSVVVLITAVFFVLARLVWRDQKWGPWVSRIYQDDQKNRIILGILLILGFGLFNLLLIPDYRWGGNIFLFMRARPVMIWGGVICAQFCLPVLYEILQANLRRIKDERDNQRFILIPALLILGLFLIVWGWMAWSGMGIFPDITFWNDPGVPILIVQVYLAITAAAVIYFVERGLKKKNRSFSPKMDWGLCILIFLAAATLWNLTPQKYTVFAPGPFPPNDEFYPHSDAEVYDLSAQNALVGGGFNTAVGCADKGLYITFLTWLNLFAGQNQSRVTFLQVTAYAILPVLIYLIGKRINNRSLGMIAASLSIFKESNAISSASFISTSMSKMLMTEVPTAILIALFILVLISWIKNDGRKLYLAGALGGVIGLSTMLRLNTYIFVPFTLLVFGWVLFKKWKWLWVSITLFFLVFFASILPWVIRNNMNCPGSQPFSYVLGPLQGVILNQRYQLPTATPNPSNEPATPQPTATLEATPGKTAGEIVGNQATPVPSGYKNDQLKNVNSPIKPAGLVFMDKWWAQLGNAGDKVKFISAHFSHNLLTSVLILPLDLFHDDLEHIANPVGSFWADNWNGQIAVLPGLFLIFNLAIIAMGCAAAWKRWKFAGIVPAIVFLGYCLALGIARTSGGRYIVPVDWILYLYYGGGIVLIIQWMAGDFWKAAPILSRDSADKPGGNRIKPQVFSSTLVLAAFLGMGLMLPGTEKIFPPQVYPPPARQTVDRILKSGGYGDLIISHSDLLIYSGRATNPRYFFYGQDIVPGGAVYFPLRYQRFIFTLVGKNTPMINVVLPSKVIPENIKNGQVVSVAGCMNAHGFMDAVMVFYNNQVYYRYPMAESLKCPIKNLVCDDDNRVCK
jgi:hypothetical protein